MQQMPSTPTCVRLYSKNFKCQLFQLFPFIYFLCPLFPLFFNRHFSLGDLFVIFLSIGMCQIHSFVKPFLHLFIFMFCIVFQAFFLHVFSFIAWLMTPISLTLLILFPFSFYHFVSQLVFVGLVILTLQVFNLGPSQFVSWVHLPNSSMLPY